MKVSFIIPIYNVEYYLEQCVNSVLNQTYTNIEVILVDDGSPDNCPAICDAFAKQDTRVKVLHKPNGGLSDARNAGLQIATGDYVIFVDSDDFWVNNDCLNRLMDVVHKYPECDFINFNCSYYYPQTETYKKWVAFDEQLSVPCDKNTAMRSLVASGTMPMSACLKVISKKSLSDMGHQFIKGIYCEDIPWFIELLNRCNNCIFINHYVYAYRKGVTTSISSSFSYKKYSDLFNLLKNGVEKNTYEFDSETKDALFSFWAYELCILRAMTGFMPKPQRIKELKELYKYNWLFKYQIHPKVKKVALVQKILGKKITNYLLHKYIKTRLV